MLIKRQHKIPTIFLLLAIISLFTYLITHFSSKPSHINLRVSQNNEFLPRILQETEAQSPIAPMGIYIEWHLILIAIAMVSNSFNMLYPLIIYLESFYFIGFLSLQRGVLNGFFTSHLNSKVSFFGFLKMFLGIDQNGVFPNTYKNAGVQSRLVYNMIPYFAVMGVLLFITLVVLPLNMILKNQKIRKFIVTLKSIWIGTGICLMPYLCFTMGAAGMTLNFNTTASIVDVIVFAISGVIIITYITLMLLEIKKHVSHPSIEELKKSVSITQPLKSSQFKFDCLVFSNKYFYLQTMFKITFYFFGIGITYDYPKIGVGVCLFGELIQFIVFITNPPYIKLRHSIVAGFSYLVLMINSFCLLIVDLNEVVTNYRVAAYFGYIILAFHLITLVLLIGNVVTDIIIAIKYWRLSKNIFTKKTNDLSLYDQETNDKLNPDETGSEKSKSKSRKQQKENSKSKSKSKNKKRRGEDKQNDNDQMKTTSKTGIYTQSEKHKFKVQIEGDEHQMPKVKKVKKAREI